MEGLPLQTMFNFLSVVQSSSNKRSRDAMTMNLDDNFTSLHVKRMPRRVILKCIGLNTVLLCISNNPVLAAPMPGMEEPEIIRTLKFDNGVRIREIVDGKGQEAHEGDVVEVNYVCRRSNGYFVHSTVDQFSGESSPVILPLDENRIIKGLKEVIIGMKVGGKRRALIPPSVGYINENLQPVPDEYLIQLW
ncbi:peptidyl-prolyl cis-trans isomerase FKBP16-1, chloroplastic isoform X2 [Ricinus communis]|uniref:peptidyl-prolyl cis-trans isomerase FKBP16-1, chloroplastic isoform X2 n=1 Tax=Ricinus communis TaxID=3988 RepID=UPI000D68DBA4|nr:peptidyl-prolyl cis-trans isomerase FKBP16-1, chloroplastic isoform X2 [Ricinus communis]|eukprot:XP_025011915.1 peptidyl-prolyl cis-trans isomerase FKBP16-1, chloroplastic isoform X2 [Ricinus communis]